MRVYGGAQGAGDVTPGMDPVVVTGRNGRLEAVPMHWGIVNPKGSLIINARAESVFDKAMFWGSIMHRRIVIPAEHFYEWDQDGCKFTFRRQDSGIIYLAGIYDMSGNRDCFAILTTAANASMEKIHDRMPLMIEEKDVSAWIFEENRTEEFLRMDMPRLVSFGEFEQLSFLP